MAALKVKRRMKGLLMFLPHMLSLCGRLLTDKRVPRAEKALFAGAVIYAVIPLDLIPDVLPFVGQIDDLYLIALTLLRLINRTDESVVRENWRGTGDIVQLAETVAGIAPLVLPQRVRRVLSSRVELAPKEAPATKGAQGKRAPLLIEIPEDAKPTKAKPLTKPTS